MDDKKEYKRFREEQLKKIHPNVDLEKAFVLWVDIPVYFEYQYESAEVEVLLDGEAIIANGEFIPSKIPLIEKIENDDKTIAMAAYTPKLKIRRPFPNIKWHLAGARNGRKVANCIPFVFDTFRDLCLVEHIIGEYVFHCFSENETKIDVCFHVNCDITFSEYSGNKDYVVELKLFEADKYDKDNICLFNEHVYSIEQIFSKVIGDFAVISRPKVIKNEKKFSKEDITDFLNKHSEKYYKTEDGKDHARIQEKVNIIANYFSAEIINLNPCNRNKYYMCGSE